MKTTNDAIYLTESAKQLLRTIPEARRWNLVHRANEFRKAECLALVNLSCLKKAMEA